MVNSMAGLIYDLIFEATLNLPRINSWDSFNLSQPHGKLAFYELSVSKAMGF